MASVGGEVAGDDRNDSGVIRIYPNGIKIIQPSVGDGIGYAGKRAGNVINPEGVE